MKIEYIQDLIGKGYEEIGLDLYAKILFDHRKNPIINIKVGYDYRDSSWSLSVSPSKFLFTDLDWDSIGSYNDIWKIYDKELAILIFLIDHDFYLLPKQLSPTMIWKGKFSDEQINMSLDSYNMWKCSIKNFVGEEKRTKITSLNNLKQFFKDNEMLDIL